MKTKNQSAPKTKSASTGPESLTLIRASSWGSKAPPEPQKFVLAGFIPAGTVTALGGDGGLGKTLIAEAMAIHIAAGRPLWGLDLMHGPVIGVFCEDDRDEIERRGRAICDGEGIPYKALDNFYFISRDNEGSLFCSFDRDGVRIAPFYRQLEREIARIRPVLVILDTAADFFAGDFMNPFHVRFFLRNCLGALCNKYGCAVLLLSHPSATGVRSGSGAGYSVQWNNAVRCRIFLSRPDSGDGNRRVLEVKKSNRGACDVSVRLVFGSGYFVEDRSTPEATRPKTATSTKSKEIAKEAVRFVSSRAEFVPFKEILEHLQRSGLATGSTYNSQRKSVQRALDNAVEFGGLERDERLRGYTCPRKDENCGGS